MAFPPTQSLVIRDAVYDRLSVLTINGAPLKSAVKAPITTLQPDQLPALGVFINSELDVPLGEKPTSIPDFMTTTEIGISWAAMEGDQSVLDGALDQFAIQSKRSLLADPSFLSLFEFVEEIKRWLIFPKEGEGYIVETRMVMRFIYQTEYPPIAPYDLTMIDIKTTAPAGTAVIEVQIAETPSGLPSQDNPIAD